MITLPDGYALTGTVVAGAVPVADVEITLNDSSTGDAIYVFGNDTDGLEMSANCRMWSNALSYWERDR